MSVKSNKWISKLTYDSRALTIDLHHKQPEKKPEDKATKSTSSRNLKLLKYATLARTLSGLRKQS